MARIPVLMYHRIGPVKKDSIVPGQYVRPEALAGHLRVMKRLGYPFIDPVAAMSGAKGTLMTFDDGYLDFYEKALPELAKFSAPSLVFLVSSLVGRTNEWDIACGDVTEPLMSWSQVQEARSHGVSFGSHTETHARLPMVSGDQLTNELVGSKARIEAELGEPCKWFCYPYGGMNEAVEKAVETAGYEAAFATKKGLLHPNSNRFEIPRINVRADTSPAVLAYKVFRAVVFGR